MTLSGEGEGKAYNPRLTLLQSPLNPASIELASPRYIL